MHSVPGRRCWGRRRLSGRPPELWRAGARRLLGMFRTVTNIWGDCCAVTVVEAWAKRYDAKLARQAKKADAAAGAPSDRVG